jgi:hypothetical protein
MKFNQRILLPLLDIAKNLLVPFFYNSSFKAFNLFAMTKLWDPWKLKSQPPLFYPLRKPLVFFNHIFSNLEPNAPSDVIMVKQQRKVIQQNSRKPSMRNKKLASQSGETRNLSSLNHAGGSRFIRPCRYRQLGRWVKQVRKCNLPQYNLKLVFSKSNS